MTRSTHSKDDRIHARDGYELAATYHAPDPRKYFGKALLVAPAMGVKREFYGRFATFLADRGVPVVTFDYRGIGGSRPRRLRGFPGSLRDWGEKDLAGAIDWTREVLPEADLYLVAHSVGGQIVGLADNHHALRGMLAVSCQSGYWGHWRGTGRLGMFLLWHAVMPGLSNTLGYFPARRFRLGEDLPFGVARDWAWWGRHPRYLLGRLGDDDGVRESYESFERPILAHSFTDDGYAPEPAVRAFLDFYPRAEPTHRRLHPKDLDVQTIGHFGFFRENPGRRLWHQTLTWVRSMGSVPVLAGT